MGIVAAYNYYCGKKEKLFNVFVLIENVNFEYFQIDGKCLNRCISISCEIYLLILLLYLSIFVRVMCATEIHTTHGRKTNALMSFLLPHLITIYSFEE